MTEEYLDGPEIRAGVQQVGGERVPQAVHGYRDPGGATSALAGVPDHAGAEMLAV